MDMVLVCPLEEQNFCDPGFKLFTNFLSFQHQDTRFRHLWAWTEVIIQGPGVRPSPSRLWWAPHEVNKISRSMMSDHNSSWTPNENSSTGTNFGDFEVDGRDGNSPRTQGFANFAKQQSCWWKTDPKLPCCTCSCEHTAVLWSGSPCREDQTPLTPRNILPFLRPEFALADATFAFSHVQQVLSEAVDWILNYFFLSAQAYSSRNSHRTKFHPQKGTSVSIAQGFHGKTSKYVGKRIEQNKICAWQRRRGATLSWSEKEARSHWISPSLWCRFQERKTDKSEEVSVQLCAKINCCSLRTVWSLRLFACSVLQIIKIIKHITKKLWPAETPKDRSCPLFHIFSFVTQKLWNFTRPNVLLV